MNKFKNEKLLGASWSKGQGGYMIKQRACSAALTLDKHRSYAINGKIILGTFILNTIMEEELARTALQHKVKPFVKLSLNGYGFSVSDVDHPAIYSCKSGVWLKMHANSAKGYTLNGSYHSAYILRKLITDQLNEESKQPAANKACSKPTVVAGDLTPLKKVEATFIMFSVKQRVSQFFLAGTTAQEALTRFAKRGVHLDPTEVTIYWPDTQAISKLEIKTEYSL